MTNLFYGHVMSYGEPPWGLPHGGSQIYAVRRKEHHVFTR